MMIMQDS